MAQEVDVDELADLEVGGGDVLDDLGEELGDVAAFGEELGSNINLQHDESQKYRDAQQ